MVRMKSHTGVVVEVSEDKAQRLNDVFGWKYLLQDESPSETISGPTMAPAAPKRRGRPPKVSV